MKLKEEQEKEEENHRTQRRINEEDAFEGRKHEQSVAFSSLLHLT